MTTSMSSLLACSLIALACAHLSAAATPAAALPSVSDIKISAEALQSWLVSTRRDLHQIPELGFQEHKTSKYIADFLTHHNISFR